MSDRKEIDPLLEVPDQKLADHLAQQSLGSSPGDLRRLMYDCGFAAGQAASRRQASHKFPLLAAAAALAIFAGLVGRWSAPGPGLPEAAVATQAVAPAENRWEPLRNDGRTYAAIALNRIDQPRPAPPIETEVAGPRPLPLSAGSVAALLD